MSYMRFYSTASFSLNMWENWGNWDGTLQYSTNANTWTTWNGTTTISAAATSGVYNLYLRGINNSYITMNDPVEDYAHSFEFTGTQPIDCEGNIESLLDYTAVDNEQHPFMDEYAFKELFNGVTLLRTAPELPATTLASNCYADMFSGCTSLIEAPELPATSLASGCYSGMFYSCTSLTTAPELPATTLSVNCYSNMFNGCSSLITAPELPATVLTQGCYYRMFAGCTSLTVSPKLPATILARSCYSYMFQGCTSLTTISKLPALDSAMWCYERMFDGTNLTLTATSDSTHATEFRIPMTGTISRVVASWNSYMFPTSSTIREPDINTTYYINATLIDPSINYMVTKSELSSIASAIREKTGNNITLTYPDDFISELNNIQPGEMTTFLSGSSLPANSLGVDGDFYTYTGS